MIYKWKPSGAPGGIDAQAAGEELERIRTHNNGRLDPANVVEASREPTAPLHPAFEWDDIKAAKAYRVDQASHIIRHIDVVIEKAPGQSAPTRAFVSVQREEDRSYTSVQHALSDRDLRLQVVAQAWAELEAWRKRHAELVEFAALFAVMDQARAA